MTRDQLASDAAPSVTRALAADDLSVVVRRPQADEPVRDSLVVNGRSGPRGWRLRLSLSFDPEIGDHVWLSALTEPRRPGCFSGVWLVPVDALGAALEERVSVGSVTLAPVGTGDRLLLEAMTAGKPWTVSVPTAWVRRYLARVEGTRRPG